MYGSPGAGAGPRPDDGWWVTRPEERQIDPRLVAQVRELHEEVERLRAQASRFGRGPGRKELRDARLAEGDLLRALGFQRYEEFARAAGIEEVEAPRPAPAVPPPAPSAPPAPPRPVPPVIAPAIAAAPPLSAPAPPVESSPTAAAGPGVPASDVRQGSAPGAPAAEHAGAPPTGRVAPDAALVPVVGEAEEPRAPRTADDGPDPQSVERVVDELDGMRERLRQLEQETRALREAFAHGLAELRAQAEAAQVNATQLRTAAFAEADRIRDEAKETARAVVEQATADAETIRREALATAEGLRRIAAERDDR